MLMAPPALTQVSVPSTLTKPAPYAAQAFPLPAGLTGSSLPVPADLSGFWLPESAAEGSTARTIARRMFRIPRFIAGGRFALADELDAGRLAAAPDHFAVTSGPGVARKG